MLVVLLLDLYHVDYDKRAATCDFQQYGILTSGESDEPVQPPFKLINSKWYLVSKW